MTYSNLRKSLFNKFPHESKENGENNLKFADLQ